MIAVDTNILVRYIVNDDALQAQKAKKLLANNTVFISKTVVLEVEWVLRAVYKLPQEEIIKGLFSVFGLENVTVEDAFQVAKAIEYYKNRFDFADALHYLANQQIDLFYTFDTKFVKRSKALELKVNLLD